MLIGLSGANKVSLKELALQWKLKLDHYPGQIDHYKRIIVKIELLFFFCISHADYHLIDICIFIT